MTGCSGSIERVSYRRRSNGEMPIGCVLIVTLDILLAM